jgi:hypothetical protein
MPAGAAQLSDLSMFPLQIRVRTRCGNCERGLRQRASDAETTLSRSPGAAVVGRMRENADLALICPIEASALLGEPALGRDYEYRRLRIRGLDSRSAQCAVSFLFV